MCSHALSRTCVVIVTAFVSLIQVNCKDPIIVQTTPLHGTPLDIFHIWRKGEYNDRWPSERELNEVFVIPVELDARVVVSNRRMTDDEYQTILDVWENRRQLITFLGVSCQTPGSNSNGVENCSCSRFIRSNDSLSNNDTRIQWVQDGMVYDCSDIPRLPENMFSNFDNLTFLKLSDMRLVSADVGVFERLTGLTTFILQHVSLDESVMDHIVDAFCNGQLNKVATVELDNIDIINSSVNHDVLGVFSCRRNERQSAGVDGQDRKSRHPLNITSIRVRYCGISTLTGRTFSALLPSGLLSIDLSHNQIGFIDVDTFQNFTNLLELILTNNIMSHLPQTLFIGLHSIRYLDLAENQLDDFSPTLLFENRQLQLLNLRLNRLRTINGDFSICTELVYVYAECNLLSEIATNTFQNCTSLRAVMLAGNHIETVDPHAFRGVHNLQILNVSNNRFSNSTALREMIWNIQTSKQLDIIIDHNNLTSVPANMCRPQSGPVINVTAIDMSHNKITAIDADAFRGLVKLKTLLLNNNEITVLEDAVFSDLTSLFTLNLSFNRIRTVHRDTFPKTSGRLYLWMNDNHLADLPMNLTMSANSFHIDLQRNHLKEIPKFGQHLLNLGLLDISRNNLTNISQESLAQFPKIDRLLLHGNSLRYIPRGIFKNNDKLRILSINNNALNLDFSVDYFADFPNDFSTGRAKIEKFNLSDNQITPRSSLCLHASFCNVKELNLSNNPLGEWIDDMHSVFSHPFIDECKLSLTRLLLRNCNLTKMSESALRTATDLEFLDIRNNKLEEFRPLNIRKKHYRVLLYSNPIQCNCHMKWLKNPNYTRRYSLSKCIHPVTREYVSFDTISESQFLCQLPGRCSVGASQCGCYSDDENNMKQPSHLMCSNKSIAQFPTDIPVTVKVIYFTDNNLSEFSTVNMLQQYEAVKELYLDRNRIVRLDGQTFKHFPFLEVVGLSGNGLERLEIGIFSGFKRLRELFLHDNRILNIEPFTFQRVIRLHVLTLHNNDLHQISAQVMEDIENLPLDNLTLHDNPWICTCTFKNWILRNNYFISKINDIQCQGSSIVALSDEQLACCDCIMDYQVASAVLIAAVGLSGVLCSVCTWYHRHTLQVLIYRYLVTRQEKADCDYDAVIAYDPDSEFLRQWTDNVLVQKLRNFRLFVAPVDMLPGTNIVNGIIDAVTNSRRTIIIIDDNDFYKSRYVFKSFEMAVENQTSDDRCHDIMLILTDEVDVGSLMTSARDNPYFRAYLRFGKQMRMSSSVFWSELDDFMPSFSSRKKQQ